MIPILFKADATSFTSFGIGVLRDCTSCEVTEERNGAYECVFKYPTNGQFYEEIKTKYPHIKVQYHGHTGPGFSPASMLEVARAGADYIDVAVEPLSWGKIHPDVITIRTVSAILLPSLISSKNS